MLRIPGSPTGGPFGANRMVYHDEYLATEIGQIGTQFDGLGHIGVVTGEVGDKSKIHYYNGVSELEMFDETGLKKNGVEKLHPIITRGILVDVAGAKGVEMLDKGYEILDGRRAGRAEEGGHGRLPDHGGRRRLLQHRLGQAVEEGLKFTGKRVWG